MNHAEYDGVNIVANLLIPVIFGTIWSENETYSVLNKIWYAYRINHAEYDGVNIFAKSFDTCHFWANLGPK